MVFLHLIDCKVVFPTFNLAFIMRLEILHETDWFWINFLNHLFYFIQVVSYQDHSFFQRFNISYVLAPFSIAKFSGSATKIKRWWTFCQACGTGSIESSVILYQMIKEHLSVYIHNGHGVVTVIKSREAILTYIQDV